MEIISSENVTNAQFRKTCTLLLAIRSQTLTSLRKLCHKYTVRDSEGQEQRRGLPGAHGALWTRKAWKTREEHKWLTLKGWVDFDA